MRVADNDTACVGAHKQTMLLLSTLGTAESIWPVGLLEVNYCVTGACGYALLLSAIQLQELIGSTRVLELDSVHGHVTKAGTSLTSYPQGDWRGTCCLSQAEQSTATYVLTHL